MRLQTGRVEIIESMGEMFLVQLRRWKDKNGLWPKKILCFRDGLSEGEWARSLDKEVSAIKSEHVYNQYRCSSSLTLTPTLTLVIPFQTSAPSRVSPTSRLRSSSGASAPTSRYLL